MPRVKLFLNDPNPGEAKLLMTGKSFEEFLSQAGKKLSLKNAQFAYLNTGQEVTPTMLEDLEEDCEIYVSEKEGFFRNTGKPGNYKLALLGVGGVGKSCITLKYIKGAFTEVYDPSIEDAFRHHVTCDGTPCILEVLDTAGQEEYKCIAQQWVKKKQGFILVYSIIDDVSFGNLKAFFDLIQDEYLNEDEESGGKIPPIVLVGNKVDLDRQRKVSIAQGRALATQWGAKFFETSAKTNENIENAFHTLIRMMRNRQALGSRPAEPATPAAAGAPPSTVSSLSGSSSGGSKGFGCVLL